MMGVTLALAAVGPATAQEFPADTITMVVGYAAGGGTDVVVRALAEPLSEELGTDILVQNVGGAGGGVAAVQVARAEPDGHTLIATTSSTFSLEPQVQQTAYDKDDFVHVATIGQFQGAILAPANAPFDSYDEMIEYAKNKDTSFKHGTYFQLDKLLMGYVADKEGLDIDFVPVQGGNGAVQAVLAGTVDTAYSGGSWAPLAESGDLKPIFATSLDRLALAPDLPSMKDFGYEIGTTSYIIVSAPAGTPEEVVQKISDAIGAVIDDENLQNMGQQRFMEIGYWGADESSKIIETEAKAFGEMFEQAGN